MEDRSRVKTPTPAFYEERIRHLEAERDGAVFLKNAAQTKLGKVERENAQLRAERREIEENAKSWNLERIALVAERQQAQEERDEWMRLHDAMAADHYFDALSKCRAERQQAIDALREIAAPMRGDVTMNERARMARAALVKLGEKP